MESETFDRVSKTLATWLSRRKVVKGLSAMIGTAGATHHRADAQEGVTQAPTDDMHQITNQAPPTNPALEVLQPTQQIAPTPTHTPWPTDPPTPTHTPWPTDPPTPTETPWPTETATPTPTSTPPAAETPRDSPAEQAPAPVQEPIRALDDPRGQIAALCRDAANVLAEDMAEPSAFAGHPHPEAAFGFLQMLNNVAIWGTNAETWDDAMLANYVIAADACALAVRVGADAYYELFKDSFPPGAFPEDPDTCIFRELAKWRDCIEGCAPDDPLCRMTCFWEFTVLHSCRRCLRGF